MRETFVTGTGQKLRNVHPGHQCIGRGCPVHAPSAKAEAIGVTHWRGDRGLMERICAHGVGHPDPDHMAFVEDKLGVRFAYYEAVHGCDGCCAGAYDGLDFTQYDPRQQGRLP